MGDTGEKNDTAISREAEIADMRGRIDDLRARMDDHVSLMRTLAAASAAAVNVER